jgi:formamidopyrimidine-DNA glycosylase
LVNYFWSYFKIVTLNSSTIPEIAEVAAIANALRIYINCIIKATTFYNKYSETEHKEKLNGLTISQVESHGKLLYFVLSSTSLPNQVVYLAINLGMEGRFVTTEAKHTKISFLLSSINGGQNKDYSLYFDESRPFGHVNIYLSYNDFSHRLQGFDLLKQGLKLASGQTQWNDACWANFYNNLKNKRLGKRMIYEHLVKQNHAPTATSFLGIGNYLKAECLYTSCISPYRTLESLTDAEIFKLYQSIFEVILLVHADGGKRIKSYEVPNLVGPSTSELGKIDKGKEGSTKGNYPLKVYKQSKDPHGNEVIAVKIKNGDQTTYWVPAVQK